jgi:transposase-like protein
MDNLTDLLENSLSLHTLEERAHQIDDEIYRLLNRRKTLGNKIKQKKPTLMYIVKGKRKAEAIDNEEIEDFVNLLKQQQPESAADTNTIIEEIKLNNDHDSQIIPHIPKVRKHYSEDIKLKAVELVEKHGITLISTRSGIHENNLKSWKKDKDEKKVKSKRGRKIRFPELENKLLTYISDRRAKQKPVTSRTIFTQARAIKKDLQISETQLKCCWGWFQKFLSRNKLSLRAPSSKIGIPLSELTSASEKFKSEIAHYFTSSKQSLSLT